MDTLDVSAQPGTGSDHGGSTSPTRGGDLQALRGQNRVAVLALLREHPDGASVSEIHHGTDLSRPTVKLAVADLIERGLVVEATIGTSTTRGGRPARRYRLDPGAGIVAGAVIGFERVDVMIGDIFGNVLAESALTRRREISFRAQISRGLRELLNDLGMAPEDVHALTVGVVGIVGPDGHICKDESLVAILTEGYFDPIGAEFSCQVMIENDANLAAT